MLHGEVKFINLTVAEFAMSYREELQKHLNKELKTEIPVEIPPDTKLGDFALPCFQLAKKFKKAPPVIAKELAGKIKKPAFIDRIEATGPYLNFFLKKTDLAKKTLLDIEYQKEKHGTSTAGKGKTIVMDYSHPNIAKPFHFGHLRSTVIGNALYLLHKSQGYKVIRLNYLGDWGTQFGGLIYAYLTWGDKKQLAKEPIKHLYDLYVKFNAAKQKNVKLEEEARAWFKKLEDGNTEASKLWAKFRVDSLAEFKKIYDTLGVSFDSFDGEAHFVRHVDEATALCKKKNIVKTSEGALVVPLQGFEVPAMLQKSDGASTYLSRDLASLLYRMKTLKADKLLYVVDHGQALHFQQLFTVAEKLGFTKDKFLHVDFGLYLSPEGVKMATRKGKAVFMEDVLNEAITLAKKTIDEKNPKLKDKDEVARAVAVSAIVFGDLMNDRNKDIVFDIQKILDFEGDTGPYLLYTYARASSIIRKAKEKKLSVSTKINFDTLNHPSEQKLITQLATYAETVADSIKQCRPHILAQYLLQVGRAFNEFYHACPVLKEEDKNKQQARMLLIDCTRTLLRNALGMLGITTPEEM